MLKKIFGDHTPRADRKIGLDYLCDDVCLCVEDYSANSIGDRLWRRSKGWSTPTYKQYNHTQTQCGYRGTKKKTSATAARWRRWVYYNVSCFEEATHHHPTPQGTRNR